MHSDPLAYFITWTCYGTWLPGDDRSWTKWHKGDKLSQPLLADWCREQMKESPVLLDHGQREVVETTIAQHCRIRYWHLHAVSCRSNHCHVVVTAESYKGETVRDQLKAWCTRKLKKRLRTSLSAGVAVREHWWTGKGSVRLIFDEASLLAAIT
jgi:hypothetical protein